MIVSTDHVPAGVAAGAAGGHCGVALGVACAGTSPWPRARPGPGRRGHAQAHARAGAPSWVDVWDQLPGRGPGLWSQVVPPSQAVGGWRDLGMQHHSPGQAGCPEHEPGGAVPGRALAPAQAWLLAARAAAGSRRVSPCPSTGCVWSSGRYSTLWEAPPGWIGMCSAAIPKSEGLGNPAHFLSSPTASPGSRGVVLSPPSFVGGSLALVSFSVPDGFCLEPRHFGAPVLPVSGIRNRGRSNTPALGSASLPLVFVVGVAEALAYGLLVRFFSERDPCDRLSKCWCPCGQEQLWFVRAATGPDGYRCLEGLPFSSPIFTYGSSP